MASHRIQPGEKEIAHGESGRLAAGQDAPDVVDQFFGLVVNDVVRHANSLALQQPLQKRLPCAFEIACQ